jgi:NAD(P)-dependent dehydrogenase (short-subunit alcohol dehydrogenase family)
MASNMDANVPMNVALNVVVMAAGKGTRMKSALPKVLHKLAGCSLLQHVLDAAAPLGPRRTVVITGHGADEVEAAVAAVVARHGRIDVMINNAGVIEPIARLSDADPALWGNSIDINLKGVFHGMKAVIPTMRAQGAGTVITVSSGAATNPLEGWSAYCAGKAGALMLTRAAHLEEGPHGIRVLGLSPGTVATEMQRKIKLSGVNPVSALDWETHIPPDWPARALVWMCGARADDWLGRDVSLRDEAVRRAVGLIA